MNQLFCDGGKIWNGAANHISEKCLQQKSMLARVKIVTRCGVAEHPLFVMNKFRTQLTSVNSVARKLIQSHRLWNNAYTAAENPNNGYTAAQMSIQYCS